MSTLLVEAGSTCICCGSERLLKLRLSCEDRSEGLSSPLHRHFALMKTGHMRRRVALVEGSCIVQRGVVMNSTWCCVNICSLRSFYLNSRGALYSTRFVCCCSLLGLLLIWALFFVYDFLNCMRPIWMPWPRDGTNGIEYFLVNTYRLESLVSYFFVVMGGNQPGIGRDIGIVFLKISAYLQFDRLTKDWAISFFWIL